MKYIIVVIGSVNIAAKLFRKIEKYGDFKVALIRTPIKISNGGCSYSLKCEEEDLEKLKIAATKYKLNIKGVYRETFKEGEVFYDSLS